MLKNYITITLRYLGRNIFFVLINIVGLGLALAVCIVAYLNNKFDADFDKYNENAEKIFRVECERPVEGSPQWYGITPYALGPLIKNDISAAEEVVRVQLSNLPIKVGEKNFYKRIGWCDPAFFKIFTVKMISGSSSAFSDMNTIYLDDELADIYFGDEDPVGKIISVFAESEVEYTFLVGGVFKKFPMNSSFNFQAIAPIDNFIAMRNVDVYSWRTWVSGTFVYLPDPSESSKFEELLKQYIPVQNNARKDFPIEKFRLDPLTKIAHVARDLYVSPFRQSLHPAAVGAPPVMAIFVLLIACFNFMNTAIAFSSRRLKEIGIRKVAGSKRNQVIMQFMGEYFLLSFISMILAVFFGKYLTSLYSRQWEYLDLNMSFSEVPELWLYLPLLLILTTFLAGAYPAFYISRFNPVYIFQDKLKIGSKNILSKILLFLQFIISVNALISGIIFSRNASFQDTIYLGYDKDNIIGVPVRNHSHLTAFSNIVKTNPKIEMVGESEEHIGNSNYSRSIEYQTVKNEVQMLDIGDNYFETMGLRLVDGREFPPELGLTDKENSIIVNKKFVEEFGIQNPVGQRVMMDDTIPLNIVGVMENIYLYGVWYKIRPMILQRGDNERMRTLVVRVSKENLEEVNHFLEEQWKELVPDNPYGGFFQDDLMDEARDINKNIKNVYIFLAFIATILSAIGLYTLISLSIIRRTKEVGIRKVMGASIPRIIRILNMEFLIILIIASVGGCISGFYLSKMMMASIWEVFTDVTVFTFLVPVILIFIVAGITIGWKVYSAASKNPTESLRYE